MTGSFATVRVLQLQTVGIVHYFRFITKFRLFRCFNFALLLLLEQLLNKKSIIEAAYSL